MFTGAQSIAAMLGESRTRQGVAADRVALSVGIDEQSLVEIESGARDAPPELLGGIAAAVERHAALAQTGLSQGRQRHLRVVGGRPLSGPIDVKSSKNAGVALLCASLLNEGTTTLRNLARILEVDRIAEVLRSLDVDAQWINGGADLRIRRPKALALDAMDEKAARRTRSAIMLLAPLMRDLKAFALPYAGGCQLGERTVEPHMEALAHFGLHVEASAGYYHATVTSEDTDRYIVLAERGDTVTENAIMAAAGSCHHTVIRNASSNYMVQDLCFFLMDLGIDIHGVGTTTLHIVGRDSINRDVEFSPSEDPIEAMSLISAGIVTESPIVVRRVPIEFLEIELELLNRMEASFTKTTEYPSANGRTRLVDVELGVAKLTAPKIKIHPMPFPGLNIDNLPFFALIAACAQGQTLVHDWVYENRAIYLAELSRLGANISLLDPHRVQIQGPTHWSAADVICPAALRPAVVCLIAMLACKGSSTLRNVSIISRGYERLADRLNVLGASIDEFEE